MNCLYCGRRINKHMEFCRGCGAPAYMMASEPIKTIERDVEEEEFEWWFPIVGLFYMLIFVVTWFILPITFMFLGATIGSADMMNEPNGTGMGIGFVAGLIGNTL